MGNYLGRGMDDITTANITVDKMEGDNAPNGVRNTLTISQRNIPSSINNITVYIDGVQQRAVTDFTLSNSTITLTSTPSSGQKIVAVTKGDATLSFISDSTVVAESFADGAITNDKLVSFDASKLTGTFDAIDGGALTGITEVTVVSSDPTITTNPDNVGDIYVNSTTGEMFSCTDKTAGANVWVNVGGGSGHIHSDSFQGEIAGFVAGGSSSANHNIIDTFSLLSSSNATDHGDLVQGVQGMGNVSTKTDGYVGGGFTSVSPNSTNIVSKFSFNSNTTSSNIGTLQESRYYAAGATSSTNGYFMGGIDLSQVPVRSIDKLTFSNDSVSNHTGSLQSPGRFGSSGTNSSTHGFISAGKITTTTAGPTTTSIDKFSFSSGTDTTGHGDLQAAGQLGAGVSSTTDGYYSNGAIEKFSFASMTTAASHGNLSNSRTGGNIAGISGTTHGWAAGGSNGPQNIIDRFPYASNSGATDWGDLTVARAPHGGHQY